MVLRLAAAFLGQRDNLSGAVINTRTVTRDFEGAEDRPLDLGRWRFSELAYQRVSVLTTARGCRRVVLRLLLGCRRALKVECISVTGGMLTVTTRQETVVTVGK